MLCPVGLRKWKYVWCLHCERVARAKDWKPQWTCPFCGADIFDAHNWALDDWPRERHTSAVVFSMEAFAARIRSPRSVSYSFNSG